MTVKTGSEFAMAAQRHNITWWPLHECSFCGVPVGYMFHNGEVTYRSACACSSFDGLSQRSWADVAAHYNRQDHPGVVARYDAFWHFDTADAPT